MNRELEYKFGIAIRDKLKELFSDECLMTIPESSDDESEIMDFVETIPHYDSEGWNQLKKYLCENLNLSFIEDEDGTSIRFSLPDECKDLPNYELIKLRFGLSDFSADMQSEDNNGFDYSDLDGMSRDEAIDYLSSLPEEVSIDVEPFNYVWVSLQGDSLDHTYTCALNAMVNSSSLTRFCKKVLTTFASFPGVYEKAKEEIQQKEEQKQSEASELKALAESLKPVLRANGWNGEFCVVPFTKDLYKLYIRTGAVSANYCTDTIENIKGRIPQLIEIAKQYIELQKRLADLGQMGFGSGSGSGIKEMHWVK